MQIALIGYGKMGQAIEAIALGRGHEIIARIGLENMGDFTRDIVGRADVAIEFTGPESAYHNICNLLDMGVPVVSGSTGWLQHYDAAVARCTAQQGAMLYASNFSVGVNVFMEINKLLAKLMEPYSDYDVTLQEIHHTAKLDAPSGTAITLAEQILSLLSRKKGWVNGPANNPDDLSIESIREDPAPGTHTVTYRSDIDQIDLIHTAKSRKGFAQGAVLAAEFLAGKKGVFTMQDVLGIPS